MEQGIFVFIFNHFIKFKWLDGYKMYGVGASMILAGLGTLSHCVATGTCQMDDSTINAFKLIAAGITVVGAAGKADKLIAATKENTTATEVGTAATQAGTKAVVVATKENK